MKKFFALAGTLGLISFGTLNVFAQQPPTITSITPSSGTISGGTSVTISGTHLDSVSVTIGGSSATSVVVAPNNLSLTAMTPAGIAGAQDVVVANADGTSTLAGGFTYTSGTTTSTSTASTTMFTLTYIAGANGTLTGSTTQMVTSGGTGTAIIAVPDSGFQFVNWSDASTSSPRTDSNVTGNISVTANFSSTSTSTSTSTPACNGSTFDTFATGTVNGQQGWHVSGDFDQAIVSNTFGYPTFGCKSFRISDATTSVFIFNQTFSSSTLNTGEATALDDNGATGTPRNRFEAQFDLASVLQTEQAGMHMSVSPDRGDGTRMSSLGFSDTASGIDVFFDDVTGTSTSTNFNETPIATGLSRSAPHTIKFLMDFIEGGSNDIVKIFIDGSLVHTGTSWENFYRYDTGAFGGPTATSSRTVNSLVFYEPGSASPSHKFNGYLVDNLLLTSTTTPTSTSTAPVITLNGSSTMSVTVNTPFVDPGATATDDIDGSVPVTATGTVDTSVIGGYSITYTATDSNSNVASTTRTVNVVATSTATTTPPVVDTSGQQGGAGGPNGVPGCMDRTALNYDSTAIYPGTCLYPATGEVLGASTSTVATTTDVTVTPATTTPPTLTFTAITPGVTIVFTRDLRLGSRGDDVQTLQKYLIANGYLKLDLPTKYFGVLTKAALRKWQANNGVPSTGYFGKISRSVLK